MLPIHAVLDDLKRAVAHHAAVVLAAPPGAGKTTVVPLALLDQPWRDDGRILVLEPRRLAARAAAERMAAYDWADFVRYDGPRPNIGKRYGVKYRVVDFIEKHILRDGRRIGGFKNYKLLKP